jgi:hypothetical protein
MEITEEEIAKIQSFGALYYPTQTCLCLLKWPYDYFVEQLQDPESHFNRNYMYGQLINEYTIDIKLMGMAHDGDIKAIELLERRKNNRIASQPTE